MSLVTHALNEQEGRLGKDFWLPIRFQYSCDNMGSTCLRDNDSYDFPWYSIWVSTELKMWFPNQNI